MVRTYGKHTMNASPNERMSVGLTNSPLETDPRNEFISGHLRRVFLLVYRIVGNVADAQDLTQEVFIKVLQRQDQLRDPEKAARWLSRIATNTAIDYLRRNRRVSFSELNEVPPIASAAADSPEQLVLRAERETRIEDGLGVLTERERVALLLRDVEDVPAEDVARHMNCSKATVRSHIANARIKLKRYWQNRKV